MKAQYRLRVRARALASLEDLWRQPGIVNLIHYSCESFYDRADGMSPRITSVAVRNIGTGQTTSFSIHLVAERKGVAPAAIVKHYNELERVMLDEFYQFVQQHATFRWLHWNMRDVSYGFAALEHRFRVLGGNPVIIPESQRVDLAWLMVDIFGPGYVKNPKMAILFALNAISIKDLLTGEEEAKAFEDRQYFRLHQSTLRKVDALVTVAARAWDGSLKTRASRRGVYGTTLIGWIESITDHWMYKVFGFVGIVASILGFLWLFR